MRGDDTLWLPGVDHASIAAQFVLDKIIAEEGETRASLGRERYLERMWQFMDETRGVIGQPDAPPGCQRRLVARALHHGRRQRAGGAGRLQAAVGRGPGLPRRGARQLVPALPHHHQRPGERQARGDRARCGRSATTSPGPTAHPIPDAWITVATTRPETIFGDTAVAVHPDDERYRDAGRPRGDPAVPRPAPADHRRRARRAGVRHRRGEDHAGPRLRRLRGGAPPRPADDQRPGRGRTH